MAVADLSARLDVAIRAVVPEITGVSIGDPANKATWFVFPPEYQAAADPIIQAFDPAAPAVVTGSIDSATDAKLRGVLDHLILAVAERLPGTPRTTAEAIRNRIIELNRIPSTRPKKP